MMRTGIEAKHEGEVRPAVQEVAEDTWPCPVCVSGRMSAFWEMRGLPVQCNALCSTREEALAVARGDIRLAVCPACGYICNTTFDPSRMAYDQAYENALHFSPRFRAYAEDLAKRIVETYDLRRKDILEIACGDGYFLRLLCKLGGNHGVGFDPSYTDRRADEDTDANVSIIRDYYGEKYSSQTADLIVCRHALEHIPDPVAFLRTVRKTIGDRHKTVVFFEVPNAMFILRDLSVWDIIYEHCCYFTIPSLVQCFQSAGFDVDDVREVYDGQFLTITARSAATHGPTTATSDSDSDSLRIDAGAVGDVAEADSIGKVGKTDSAGTVVDDRQVGDIVKVAQNFAENFSRKLDTWAMRFESLAASNRKAVLWGAGSKGITILNMLQGRDGTDGIEYVVDINPRKHGKFVAGAGQEIVPPKFLKRHRPDTTIVMNPAYKHEVAQQLRDIGVDSELVAAGW